MLPPDPDNPRESFTDVHSGVRLPTLHCAFAGCTWTDDVPMATHWDMEKRLFEHLRNRHAAEEMREVCAHVQELQEREAALIRVSWVRAKEVPLLRRERREDPQMRALAYYVAAVCEQERQHMPLIGPSVDRRTLTLVCRLARSATLRALVCFTCAQVFTSVKAWERMYGSAAGRWCLEAGDSKAQIRMCKVEGRRLGGLHADLLSG